MIRKGFIGAGFKIGQLCTYNVKMGQIETHSHPLKDIRTSGCLYTVYIGQHVSYINEIQREYLSNNGESLCLYSDFTPDFKPFRLVNMCDTLMKV